MDRDGTCCPGEELLVLDMLDVGWHTNQSEMSKAVRAIEALGWWTVTKVRAPGAPWPHNEYTLLKPPRVTPSPMARARIVARSRYRGWRRRWAAYEREFVSAKRRLFGVYLRTSERHPKTRPESAGLGCAVTASRTVAAHVFARRADFHQSRRGGLDPPGVKVEREHHQ
jgi:hypothetical protein